MTRKRTAITGPHQSDRESQCPHDGATLDDRGYCWSGGGYPLARWVWDEKDKVWTRAVAGCTFACPNCGGRLEWDGACWKCMGSESGKPGTWTFTGWSHGLTKGHWVRDETPGPACSMARVKVGMRIVHAILRGEMTAGEGVAKIQASV